MMMEVLTNETENKFIKEIVKYQLESLEDIRKGNMKKDVTLYCIQNGINIDELRKEIDISIEDFKAVYDHPGYFLLLSQKNLSIFKHIMFALFDDSYTPIRSKIWKKIYINETFFHSLN